MTQKIIYCSGPLFSPEETAGMQALADVLEGAGFDTFLPHRDGLEPHVLPLLNNPAAALPGGRAAVDRAVFALDVFQLFERCAAVVTVLNGRTPDEGAVVEAALAGAAGKPLLFYKNDARAPFGGLDNAMILGLTTTPTLSRLQDIPAALHRVLKKDAAKPPPLPPHLKKAVALGRGIWAVLQPLQQALGTNGPNPALVKKVLGAALGA